MKIVIAGYPKTGKTTLATEFEQAGYVVRHTDSVIDLGHGADSQAVSEWFNDPGDWVVEGVTAPRAIRKWLDQHPGEKFPADMVVFLREHVVPWESKGTFVKGLDTVWGQVTEKVRLRSESDLLECLRLLRAGVVR